MTFSILPQIMGPDLSGYPEHFTADWIDLSENGFFRKNRQRVHRAGQPLNLQIKAKEPFTVIFVGKFGKRCKAAPKCDLICN